MEDRKPTRPPKVLLGFSKEGPFVVERLGPLLPGREVAAISTPLGTGQEALDAAHEVLKEGGYNHQPIHGEDGRSSTGWNGTYEKGWNRIFGES